MRRALRAEAKLRLQNFLFLKLGRGSEFFLRKNPPSVLYSLLLCGCGSGRGQILVHKGLLLYMNSGFFPRISLAGSHKEEFQYSSLYVC